ncbi:hypothetical protein ElyMa_006157600 [Elysia marginata]|uniref:Uncharacterized protein n=1 Tax=Elysia marginata TaxID=1093978 RepID=A0AAV4GYY5_9GAST|nr:hypothetical protein ElyMa_006157600 [Elysia marginata]
MSSNRIRAKTNTYKRHALTRPRNRHANTSSLQPDFRSLLLEAMDKQRKGYLLKKARPPPEFQNLCDGELPSPAVSNDRDSYGAPFTANNRRSSRRENLKFKLDKPSTCGAKYDLDFDNEPLIRKTLRVYTKCRKPPIKETIKAGDEGWRQNDGSPKHYLLAATSGPLLKRATTVFKTGDVSRPTVPTKQDKQYTGGKSQNLTVRDGDGSKKKLDYQSPSRHDLQQQNRRVMTKFLGSDTNDKSRQKKSRSFIDTCVPYLVVDNTSGEVMDGKNNFLVLTRGKSLKSKTENLNTGSSVERRQVDLQKLRKTFIERNHSKSQPILDDTFYGDFRRKDSYSSQPGAGKSRNPNCLQSQCLTHEQGKYGSQPERNQTVFCDSPTNEQFAESKTDVTNPGLGRQKRVTPELHKTKGKPSDLARSTSATAKSQREKSIYADGERQRRETSAVRGTKDANPGPAGQRCVITEAQEQRDGQTRRSVLGVSALRHRERVWRTETGTPDNRRASSIGLGPKTLSKSKTAVGTTRRARSLENKEVEFISHSIIHKRRRPITPRLRMQMTHKVNFKHSFDVQDQKERQTETPQRLEAQPIDISQKRISFLKAQLVSNHVNGNPHKQQMDSPKHSASLLKPPWPVENEGKSSPSHKPEGEFAKLRGDSKSPVSKTRPPSPRKSPISSSIKSNLQARSVAVSTLHRCLSLSPSKARARKMEKDNQDAKTSFSFNQISKAPLGPFHNKKKLVKSRGITMPLRKSLSQTDELKSTGNAYQQQYGYAAAPSLRSGSAQIYKARKSNIPWHKHYDQIRFAQKPKTSWGSKLDAQDWNGKTQMFTNDRHAVVEQYASPCKDTGRVRRKSPPGKGQANGNRQRVRSKTPVLFTEHRALKRMKEKATSKQTPFKKPMPRQDQTAKSTASNFSYGGRLVLPGEAEDQDLCGWQNDLPEMLCFLRDDSGQAAFYVPGADKRCSYTEHQYARECSCGQQPEQAAPQRHMTRKNSAPGVKRQSAGKEFAQHNARKNSTPSVKRQSAGKEFAQHNAREDSALGIKRQTASKEFARNTEESGICRVTRKRQKTNLSGLQTAAPSPSMVGRGKKFCSSNVDQPVPSEVDLVTSRQSQKRSSPCRRKEVIKKERVKTQTRHERIKEYDFYNCNEENMKRLICMVLESSHCMASSLIEVREKIEMLKKSISKPKTGSRPSTCTIEAKHSLVKKATKDPRIWTPTFWDYFKLVVFMGFQLLAQYVFVKKWY